MERNDNDIWYEVIEGLISYLNEEIYTLNDTNLDVIRIVDNIGEINPNKVGYTFVKDDNVIYDENSNIIQQLIVGDTFTKTDETYYINQKYSSVKELGEQWNNTIIGNEGFRVSMGATYIDDTTFVTPAFKIAMREQDDINMLEKEGTDLEKTLIIEIFIQISEEDLFDRQTGYGESNRASKLISELIYDFFNDAQTKAKYTITNRIKSWKGKFAIITESKRPIIISSLLNTITYR